MQTGIDKVVCRSKMIFPITTIDERKVLQVGIIIEGKIIEHNDTEELQNLNRSGLNVPTDDVSALLVTQIAILEIVSTIGIRQSCKGSKIFLTIFLTIRTHIETSAQICCFTIAKETD